MENNNLNKDSFLEKEKIDKLLLKWEIILGVINISAFVGIITLLCYGNVPESIVIGITVLSTISIVTLATFMLKIEQLCGYYQCKKCNHKYVPEKYEKLFFAPHIGRTRYMKCPKCDKKSWQKKII